MNLFFAIIQFIIIAVILIMEVEWKSPGMFLWATLFLMFGFSHLFDILLDTSEYSEAVLIKASLFVIAFCLFYIVTRFFLLQKFHIKIKEMFLGISSTIQQNKRNTTLLFIMLIMASSMMTGYVIAESGGILNTSWGKAREIALHRSYFSIEQIGTIIYFATGGLLCCSLVKKSKVGIVISFVCMGFVEVVTRNRVLILPLLVSIIAYFVFQMKRINFFTMFTAAVGAICVIYIVYAIRAFRWMGDLGGALQEFNIQELNEQIKTFLVTSDGELGLRNWMYYYIENNNQFENFGKGHTYIRMLLVYIPTRFSFGLKPPDFALSMGSAIGMLEGGSMHPTLFGDCFANLGYAGVLLGILWAWLLHINDRIIDKMRCHQIKVLVFILLAVSYIIIGRGAVYNGFVNIAWGIPILVLISMLKFRIPKIRLFRRTLVHYGKE